ncbi:Sin3 associated polypeptide p18-domain-containing protein [Kalaharituber pfeilii]|nr:Sin3 associated polypeptide p18-domain-containing protein [Kalaharituber pfeilii]
MSAAADSSGPIKVDRQSTTPFLLKLFYRNGGFHRLEEFRSTSLPSSFVDIYTWKDCTLSELATLLSQALPEVVPPRSRCGFRLIFANTQVGRYVSKDLGAVVIGTDAVEDPTGKKTLDEVRFVTGDWVDVAVYPEGYGGVGGVPGSRGGIAAERGRGGYGGLGGSVPSGEWRRGERVEDTAGSGGAGRRDAPGSGGGYGRRGRGGRW